MRYDFFPPHCNIELSYCYFNSLNCKSYPIHFNQYLLLRTKHKQVSRGYLYHIAIPIIFFQYRSSIHIIIISLQPTIFYPTTLSNANVIINITNTYDNIPHAPSSTCYDHLGIASSSSMAVVVYLVDDESSMHLSMISLHLLNAKCLYLQHRTPTEL